MRALPLTHLMVSMAILIMQAGIWMSVLLGDSCNDDMFFFNDVHNYVRGFLENTFTRNCAQLPLRKLKF